MDAVTATLAGHTPDLRHPGVPELTDLAGCPQTAAHHAEGDVATHTAMALAVADQLTGHLGDTSAGPTGPTILRLATVLHDIGKPGTTRETAPGRYSAHGHAEAGAQVVSTLFATHPALARLPLGVHAAVHACVRNHMWSYHIDQVTPGALLRMTHLVDPRLLAALWEADTRGRTCTDHAKLADQVAYARLALAEAGADRADSHGLLDQITDPATLDPHVRRHLLRGIVTGHLADTGATTAALAAAEARRRPGSLTYTIGLPGLGKSTWATRTWTPAVDGLVLSAAGARRRDRRAAAAAALAELPRALAAGRHVCLDATHLTRQSRDILLSYADRYRVPVHAVYFHAPLAVSLSRQPSRPLADQVPETAIRAMASKLRWPTPDEYGTLTVIDAGGRPWPYTPATRWLTGTALADHSHGHTSPWHTGAPSTGH